MKLSNPIKTIPFGSGNIKGIVAPNAVTVTLIGWCVERGHVNPEPLLFQNNISLFFLL